MQGCCEHLQSWADLLGGDVRRRQRKKKRKDLREQKDRP